MNVRNWMILAVFFGGFGFTADETNVSQGLTLKGPGLAVHGYDVVAYFKESKAVRGSAKWSTVHEGATYRFSDKKALAAFKKDPKKYAPQFGGYCAFGVSVGAKFDGDPHFWRVVNGKLYLNLNGDIQKKWMKDVKGNISKAEKNWTTIASKAPHTLK